jgi:trimeric autotransporter adhesin
MDSHRSEPYRWLTLSPPLVTAETARFREAGSPSSTTSRREKMNRARLALLVAMSFTFAVAGCFDIIPTGPPLALAFDPPNAPTQSAFGVPGNGAVVAIVPHGGVTYIGGNFDEVAAITGSFVRLNAATAKRVAPLVEVYPGEVRAAAPDGAGGFYVGGVFSTVGGQIRRKLAHIFADGSLDPAFTVGVTDQTSAVNALAVSGDGGTLYVGGAFDSIGDQERHNLAAINLATGAVTNFDPAGLGTDGQVFALKVSGSQVYVGGQFDKLGGQTRHGLAKVEATTGGDLGWIPDPTFNGGGGLIFAIEAAGSSIYVGGVFTNIGGQPRTHLASLSATNATASAAFAPNPTDAVFALALSGTNLYVGGDFDRIAGQPRPTLARLDATNGALSPFDAQLLGTDAVRALAVSGPDLFIGGFLTSVGGQPRRALAKVSAATGALGSFDASVGSPSDTSVAVKVLAVNGPNLYAGGNFSFVNTVTRHGIAALDADGVPTAFNPDAGPGGPNTFNDVSAIAVTDNAVYLGGNFTSMGGRPRNRIAKVRLDGTLDLAFNPNATGGNIPGVDTIVVTSTDVYAGGDFSTIGNAPRIDLARLNPVTGLVDGGRQSFDPDPLNGVSASRVRRLQVAGDVVYVSGDFTTIGGRARNKIAKISATTGDADVLFDAHVSGGSNVGPNVSDIVLARSTLFVGGDFSSIGGAPRNNVATLNPLTGAEVTGFDPNVTGGPRPQVFTIVVTEEEVYIGGSFTFVGGAAQGQIARLTKTGQLTSFNPRIRDQPGTVLALAASGSTLYAGGFFFEMAERPRWEYAQFTDLGP